jgi:hypothetical protein
MYASGSGSYLEIFVAIENICCQMVSKSLKAVFRIRIHMFLSLQDPDPDPLVRGMDPDPDQAPNPDQSSCKNSKKNLDSFYFVTFFDFLSLKNDVNVP